MSSPDLLALAAAHPPDGATAEAHRCHLARREREDLAAPTPILASALLDFLSVDELSGLLRTCAGLPLLFALTVVGRVELTPAEPLDARLEAAFNAHQRRLLGPDAVATAVALLRGTGAEIEV